MGIPSRSTQEYRDDPDAVSLHTTPDDYNYDDAPEIAGLPPSYADSEGTGVAPAAPPIRHLPPPPNDFKRMDHDNLFQMTRGKPKVWETQEVMESRCDTDAGFLEERVHQFSRVPPSPLVYIYGSHKETVRDGDKKKVNEVCDFRIVLNLQQYLWATENGGRFLYPGEDGLVEAPTSMRLSTVLNGEKTYRGSFIKKRAPGFKQDIEVGAESPSLREWCHRYCASPSKLRIFRVQHNVLGLDEAYLQNRLGGLIRGTGYHGKINITFPIEDKNIDIYTSNRINEWRLKTWVCWIFYLTFLWIFTWPYLFFATKRYAVVKADWLFSSVDENGTKKYATISEEEWFERWHVGIRRLALDKYQGAAAYAHLQGVIDRPADPPMPGRIATGHAGVDNAVGLLQQGFRVASVLSRGDPMGALQNGWGYDN
jgi:hypothetical protein